MGYPFNCLFDFCGVLDEPVEEGGETARDEAPCSKVPVEGESPALWGEAPSGARGGEPPWQGVEVS